MTLKTMFLATLTAITVATTAASADTFLILDILPIRDGKTLAEAEAYFGDVEPIFARHGMTRSDAVLSVVDVVRGDVDAEVVNLWQTDNPKASFDGIFSDKEYRQHTANRDAIFDLPSATIVVTQRQGE